MQAKNENDILPLLSCLALAQGDCINTEYKTWKVQRSSAVIEDIRELLKNLYHVAYTVG